MPPATTADLGRRAGPSLLTAPPLPGRDAALFLDLDGTLIEIAPTPDSVAVPPDLPPLLGRLAARLGGAVAIVTGRSVGVARALVPTPGLAMGCEHGAVLDPPDAPGEDGAALPVPPPEWRAAADAFAGARPGALAEHKAHGLVLHFRLAPDSASEARAFAEALAATDPAAWRVVPAHAAAELRPRAADKGRAVARLMTRAAFAGRVPLFVGDDVTDEDGIAACAALGGGGYRMAPDFGGSPAALRGWLAAYAKSLGA